MANVKNAKKKIKQIEKTTKANEQLKSTVKNSIKKTDKSKGLVHKNKVDRVKSRLTKKVNKMESK